MICRGGTSVFGENQTIISYKNNYTWFYLVDSMSGKAKKGKKHKSQPANRTRVILKLQKHGALSQETAMTLKELGLGDHKRFGQHLEVLEADKVIKSEGSGENARYWLQKGKAESKKEGGTSSFLFFWLTSTVVLFVVVLMFVL